MKTRSYFEEFLHLTNPRTLKEDVEIDVKEPAEDDIEAADGAVVAPIIDPEMGYDTGDVDDTQVEQDGSAYIGKSVVDCHVCNNAFFIDGMEIPEELVCPVCAAPASDLELVGIVEPIPEEEPVTTDNSDEQGNDNDDEDDDGQEGDYESENNDEGDVEESAGKANFYKKAKMTENNKHISKLTEDYWDLTVGELATILQEALDTLSDYDDEDVVVTQSNSYGMYGNLISIPSKGYVELDNINVQGYGDYEDMDDKDSVEALTEAGESKFDYDALFQALDNIEIADDFEYSRKFVKNAADYMEEADKKAKEIKDAFKKELNINLDGPISGIFDDNPFIQLTTDIDGIEYHIYIENPRVYCWYEDMEGMGQDQFNSLEELIDYFRSVQDGYYEDEEDMDESLKRPKRFVRVKKARRASGVVKTNAKANINKGKSVVESRQAMSKKIKDIYENRRAAQNTQVKKKSDVTNEAINPENAKDNAVLKNILLGRGNKKLSAEEQAVLDKYGFIASDKGGSKLITNPATQNTIYLITTRDTYSLYLANKETHRRVGNFDKDSEDPKGLNAVDLIGFLNSESEPMQDYITKASRLNRDISKVLIDDISHYQEVVNKLEKRLKDAMDSNADPDYIQLIQTRLDDSKKYLRKLQRDKGYSDKDAFAYRRYMDDPINDNITAYKKLKRDLDYTQGRLKSAKDKIAASTSKWTIEQLQNQIAELQKQLDQALSGVGDEEDEQRVKDLEKRTQEIRAKIDNLFANVKRSTDNK